LSAAQIIILVVTGINGVTVPIRRAALIDAILSEVIGRTGRDHRKTKLTCAWTRGPQLDACSIAAAFQPGICPKVADEIKPGTTVVITDQPVVRKSKSDSTFFALN
jgi:hypothetical protein